MSTTNTSELAAAPAAPAAAFLVSQSPKKVLAALNAASVATAVARQKVANAVAAINETDAVVTAIRAAQTTVRSAREALKNTGDVDEYLLNISQGLGDSLNLAIDVQNIAYDTDAYARGDLEVKIKEELAVPVLPRFSRIEIPKMVVFVDDDGSSKKRKHDHSDAA